MSVLYITLGINSKVCNLAVRFELGQYSLHMNIFTTVLKDWACLSRMQEHPTLVDAFHLAVDMLHSNKPTWALSIFKLLKELNLTLHWTDKNDSNSTASFAPLVKTKLKLQFLESWIASTKKSKQNLEWKNT